MTMALGLHTLLRCTIGFVLAPADLTNKVNRNQPTIVNPVHVSSTKKNKRNFPITVCMITVRMQGRENKYCLVARQRE